MSDKKDLRPLCYKTYDVGQQLNIDFHIVVYLNLLLKIIFYSFEKTTHKNQKSVQLNLCKIFRLISTFLPDNNDSDNKKTDTMSARELNKRIDKSMEDSRNGRLTEANDLLAEIEKWS